MDPFEAGRIQRGDGISSNEQEGQENEAGAQWDGVLTGYDVADSAHVEDDQDQTVENWAAERDVGPLEDREEALTRLNLSEFNQHLDLESLSLTSFPRFSTDLRRIDVPFNRLTRLPDSLPATLESLNVSHNQLTNLPALPARLEYLNASHNRLASLPEALPPALQLLDVSYNQLRNLPEVLPAALELLDASHNQLSSLPENLPATLGSLGVNGNQLTRLPEALPPGLELLLANDNQLTSLPENLLTQLGADASVDLSGNPLPEQVLTNLHTAVSAAGYTVILPGNHVSELSSTDDERDDPLTEAVADWLRGNPKDGDREVLAAWRTSAEEPGAEEYALFLGKLFESVNSDNQEFQQSVANDLREAAKNPQLRAQYFQLAADANQSCEDRRTLTWNGMQTARLIADVENGVYDERARLPDLIDLGRVMFRLDALEGIAREKAQSLGSVDNTENIDAIEVYLAYQNKLRERLGLQHVAPNMRFFEVSGVTDADVDSAEKTVRSKEAAEFADYLATDWQPWDDVLSRIAPDDHAAMQDQLIDAMGEEFDGRLEQQLADKGLSGTESDLVEDAKRELGAKVRKGALRDRVLNDHGLRL